MISWQRHGVEVVQRWWEEKVGSRRRRRRRVKDGCCPSVCVCERGGESTSEIQLVLLEALQLFMHVHRRLDVVLCKSEKCGN